MEQIGLDLQFDEPEPEITFDFGEDDREQPQVEEMGEVVVHFERHHKFVPPSKKPKRGDGLCQVCHRKHGWIEHLGFPAQLHNDSGTDPIIWQDEKKMWQLAFGEALHQVLPRGCVRRVMIHAHYTFEDQRGRDRDNLLYPFSKFFADTMVRGRFITVDYDDIDWDSEPVPGKKTFKKVTNEFTEGEWGEVVRIVSRTHKKGKPVTIADPLGGWIPDDTWQRFEIVDMSAECVRGHEALDVRIMPSMIEPPPWPPIVGS